MKFQITTTQGGRGWAGMMWRLLLLVRDCAFFWSVANTYRRNDTLLELHLQHCLKCCYWFPLSFWRNLPRSTRASLSLSSTWVWVKPKKDLVHSRFLGLYGHRAMQVGQHPPMSGTIFPTYVGLLRQVGRHGWVNTSDTHLAFPWRMSDTSLQVFRHCRI